MQYRLMAAGGACALGAVLLLSPAEAAPIAPPASTVAPAAHLQLAVATGQAADHMGAKLTLIRGGCGWGAHRTWSGRCHLNYGWRGRVRARAAWWRARHWY